MKYIYKITNKVNGKIYIGKADSIEKRWNQHLKESFNIKCPGYNYPIHKAIRKYGVENFTIVEIDRRETIVEINECEKFWIKELKSQDALIGYNLCNGGQGGDSLTPEQHKKQGATLKKHYLDGTIVCPMKGKKLSDETKSLISKNTKFAMNKQEVRKKLKGNTKKRSDVEKLEISKRFKGIPKTQEHKEKISKALTGIPLSEERKKNISAANSKGQHARGNNPRAKKIICIETQEVFDCAPDAAEKYGCNGKSIRCCCNGKYKTAGGYHWAWYLKK